MSALGDPSRRRGTGAGGDAGTTGGGGFRGAGPEGVVNGGGGGGGRGEDFAAAPERPRAMWRTVTAALLFFVTGSLMLYFGLLELRESGRPGADAQARERGLAMLVVGGLTFLPGSYAVAVLLGAWLGWQGYSYDTLPSYDEE